MTLCGQSQVAAALLAATPTCNPRSEAMALPHHSSVGGNHHESASQCLLSLCFSMRLCLFSRFISTAQHITQHEASSSFALVAVHTPRQHHCPFGLPQASLALMSFGSLIVTLPNLSRFGRTEITSKLRLRPKPPPQLNFTSPRSPSCTVSKREKRSEANNPYLSGLGTSLGPRVAGLQYHAVVVMVVGLPVAAPCTQECGQPSLPDRRVPCAEMAATSDKSSWLSLFGASSPSPSSKRQENQ